MSIVLSRKREALPRPPGDGAGLDLVRRALGERAPLATAARVCHRRTTWVSRSSSPNERLPRRPSARRPAREVGKAEDPEIEARRQRILDVLLEASPQKKEQLRQEGQLTATRAFLRRVLAGRQLTPSQDDDTRIDACTDLATLERWLDPASNASSISDVLR